MLAFLKGLTAPLPGTNGAPRPVRRQPPAPALRRDEVAVLQIRQEDALDDQRGAAVSPCT